jgi:C-terminal processing protease CtpA/Prc
MIQPNRIHYTKPIIVLIDEMSGSGGDAFPAMMQGLGKLTLGTRTMGAGGHVTAMPNLDISANKVNITKSLFFRPDGEPVENNSAVANIAYQPTRDDFLYEYRNYQKRYLEELAKLIP